MIDGILILSGILKKYEQRVLSKFVNFTLVEKKEDDHWVTLVLRKNNE
jgi:ribosomal protein L11 methylase PrmA